MKKSRTLSATGSKGLKSWKTRERGHFASSQVNKIFILLTNASKFIAALPGGFSGFQGSPPAADDLCLPSLSAWLDCFSYLTTCQKVLSTENHRCALEAKLLQRSGLCLLAPSVALV